MVLGQQTALWEAWQNKWSDKGAERTIWIRRLQELFQSCQPSWREKDWWHLPQSNVHSFSTEVSPKSGLLSNTTKWETIWWWSVHWNLIDALPWVASIQCSWSCSIWNGKIICCKFQCNTSYISHIFYFRLPKLVKKEPSLSILEQVGFLPEQFFFKTREMLVVKTPVIVSLVDKLWYSCIYLS